MHPTVHSMKLHLAVLPAKLRCVAGRDRSYLRSFCRHRPCCVSLRRPSPVQGLALTLRNVHVAQFSLVFGGLGGRERTTSRCNFPTGTTDRSSKLPWCNSHTTNGPSRGKYPLANRLVVFQRSFQVHFFGRCTENHGTRLSNDSRTVDIESYRSSPSLINVRHRYAAELITRRGRTRTRLGSPATVENHPQWRILAFPRQAFCPFG